jgi:hypothetical protein
MPFIIIPAPNKTFATHTNSEGEYFNIIDTSKARVEGTANTVTDISNYTALPPKVEPVPKEVPLWAFRSILMQDGLLQDVTDAIDKETDLNKKIIVTSFLEYGNTVTRSSSVLNSIAVILNKTQEDIDDVFRRASKLKI